MRTLSQELRAERLKKLAKNREVDSAAEYLRVYPDLLAGIQALRPLNRQNTVLASHAIFGWMPTQLRLDLNGFDAAVEILMKAEAKDARLSKDEISLLAGVFQTMKGRSVVAASKILHFINPEVFPIWDRWTARRWGVSANGKQAAGFYVEFVDAMCGLVKTVDGREACEIMRRQVADGGFPNNLSLVRLAELILFLPPR